VLLGMSACAVCHTELDKIEGCTPPPSLREALKTYELRKWIEEMFGDLKDIGFNLESTHLTMCLISIQSYDKLSGSLEINQTFI
jgi:hypothetical protein